MAGIVRNSVLQLQIHRARKPAIESLPSNSVGSFSFADTVFKVADVALRTVGVDTSDTRISLVLSIGNQAVRNAEKASVDAAVEVSKYINPQAQDAGTLEESLMSVPNLETVPSSLISKDRNFEIRSVQAYFVAETEMKSREGFDFLGASQSFNVLAKYLFGDNEVKQDMQMTTPVMSKKSVDLDMTTPVLSSQESGKWKMSFLLPSKYRESTIPAPNDSSVVIRRIEPKTVAVLSFSGAVTDKLVESKEEELREKIAADGRFRVSPGASLEVAQYNPPFTLPFQRRNEVWLQVEWVEGDIVDGTL